MTLSAGIAMFMTQSSIGPAELAREAEARGFESLFLPEHTHVPVTMDTPHPFFDELPDEYRRTLDPFVALTAAALATERLRIGTGICLMPERDPIVTAKVISTLDVLSGGRFVFGVGFGFFRDELASHGVRPQDRWAITREKVLAMQALWKDEIASFDGNHVHLPPSWSWPKPAQRPHPPVLIGGGPSERTFRHVIEYGDGWIPIGDQPGYGYESDMAASIRALREAAETAGRDPDSIVVSIHGGVFDDEHMDRYLALHETFGVQRVVSYLPTRSRDAILPLLDEYSRHVPARS